MTISPPADRTVAINCPKCHHQSQRSLDHLKNGRDVVCPDCKRKFRVNAVQMNGGDESFGTSLADLKRRDDLSAH